MEKKSACGTVHLTSLIFVRPRFLCAPPHFLHDNSWPARILRDNSWPAPFLPATNAFNLIVYCGVYCTVRFWERFNIISGPKMGWSGIMEWNGVEWILVEVDGVDGSMECIAVECNGMESMECIAVEWNGMDAFWIILVIWIILGHLLVKKTPCQDVRPSGQIFGVHLFF